MNRIKWQLLRNCGLFRIWCTLWILVSLGMIMLLLWKRSLMYVFYRVSSLNFIQVVTEPELSDECHLVWKNYHSLSKKRIESFLKLKPCGLYLLIDTLKWERPTDEYEYSNFNSRFFVATTKHMKVFWFVAVQNYKFFSEHSFQSISTN